MSRIRLSGLRKAYGDTVAVAGIDLDVADGEFLVLLGPSGCGKSTLLRMVAGLIAPTGGRVLVDDADVTDVAPRDRDLAMVFQSYALYPHLTVESNIGFPLRVRGERRAVVREKVAAVAAELGLTDLLRRRPKQLSGGQRQRVALGRALVREPGAFLMDEPLSNLDAKLRTTTRAGLTELHRRLRATVLYVTHDQVEAMTMADRVALLDGGRLAQVGTPAEVYDTPASTFVAGFLGAPPMNLLDVAAVVGAHGVRASAAGLDLALPDDGAGQVSPEGSRRALVLGVRPEHLVVRPPGAADAPFRGRVLAVENLGSEELARCVLGDADDGPVVTVRGARPLGLAAGDHVGLAVDPARVHLFDPDSGRRLERRPGSSTPSSPTPSSPTTPTSPAVEPGLHGDRPLARSLP
ncbi:ABC transporter ATP-binding protein [Actinomycetospora chiangmaiensis]|uniref:ABC transporter ATP-binding protein n=1 Tax=Actinomycetospora chiangmaiensis TaxID=402650 RepID=UPI00036CA87C|nr:ABC transporter ATP-binding protein [Actinomycetospora chiangmaiensis]